MLPGEGLEVEDRVQHELELAPARPEDGVEAQRPGGEGAQALLLDGEDREDEPGREADRGDRDAAGEAVLAQAAPHQEREAGLHAALPVRASASNSSQRSKAPRISSS